MPSYPVFHVALQHYDYEKKQRGPWKRFWSYRTREEAEAQRDKMIAHVQKVMTSEEGHRTPYRVEEEQVETDFVMPSEEKPRDLYYQRHEGRNTKPGCWDVTDVRVYRKGPGTGDFIGSYHRDYPGKPPFEPFRQGERHYALISLHYEQTDIMDLSTGKIIAAEDKKDSRWGFCPVGFYVPDWRDVHDDSSFPGSWYWEEHDRWPDGTLGFVWGCYWGDDSGWKVQALDLSRVSEGIITRDDRFGYQYLDTRGDSQDFIRVQPGEGNLGPRVTFSVPKLFTIAGEKLDLYDR